MARASSIIQLENNRVIVTQWRFVSGAETGWHKHNYDYVVVPQTTGQLCIISKLGETIADLMAGLSYARAKGVEHNVINHSDHEFIFIEIELK